VKKKFVNPVEGTANFVVMIIYRKLVDVAAGNAKQMEGARRAG